MSHMDPYERGTRDGLRWAVTWLHERANKMSDPHAKQVLHSAAFSLGVEASRMRSGEDAKDGKAKR